MTKPLLARRRGPGPAATVLRPFDQGATRRPLVLIGDAEEWSARSLESILAPAGYDVARARSGAHLLERVGRTRPHAVLLGDHLPDADVVALCARLRGERNIGECTPILVVLSRPAPRELRLALLRAGAWELVGLPVDAEELVLKLRVLQSARRAAEAARAESLVDPESGLYNLRGLLRRAREMGAEARRHRRSLACAIMDCVPRAVGEIGHLEAVFGSIQQVTRDGDVVGRLGGGEFVVLAPETDPVGVIALAQRLAEAAEGCGKAIGPGRCPTGWRVGCYAVEDFSAAGIEPVELLVRAANALRSLPEAETGERIRFFGGSAAAAAASA